MKDIIVQGREYWAERKFECNACGCIFKATPPDYRTVYAGDKRICFVTSCPYCGVDAYTPPKLIAGVKI